MTRTSPVGERPDPSGRRRPFLTVKEAAGELRLDESTLYRHLREGRFPGVKVGGRYLVPAAVIEELAAGAMDAGHCVDIGEWTGRWREQRAAAALATGSPITTPARPSRKDSK